MNSEKESRRLDEISQELIRNGFRVFRRPGVTLYLYAVLDGQIGYLEKCLSDYNYSTVHKPATSIGTGFRFEQAEPFNIERMRNCCRCFAPEWVGGDRGFVQKWKLDEFLKKHPELVEVTKVVTDTDQ